MLSRMMYQKAQQVGDWGKELVVIWGQCIFPCCESKQGHLFLWEKSPSRQRKDKMFVTWVRDYQSHMLGIYRKAQETMWGKKSLNTLNNRQAEPSPMKQNQ